MTLVKGILSQIFIFSSHIPFPPELFSSLKFEIVSHLFIYLSHWLVHSYTQLFNSSIVIPL